MRSLCKHSPIRQTISLANNRTRYGIEGIAQTYEDPFGVAKIDINMDDIVEDARQEVEVLLTAWQTQGPSHNDQDGIFRPRTSETPKSDSSSISDFYSGDGEPPRHSQVRFVVSDVSEGRYRDEDSDGVEIGSTEARRSRLSKAISPESVNTRSGKYSDAA